MSGTWIEDSRLWLVLDRQAAVPRSLVEVTELAIAGGADAVLCRIRNLPRAEVLQLARPLRERCRELNTPFVMSHQAELALELSADAVQLGIADPPVAQVRTLVGSGIAIGYSTHGVGEALARFEDGVDYVFLGPIFATPEKLKYGSPLGLEAVEAAQSLPGPVIFIGGINPANCAEVVRAGGRRVAAISALQRTADPSAQARAMLRELTAAADG